MFVKNNDAESTILDKKSSRKILSHGGDLLMAEVHFDEGGIGAIHTHMHEQISYIAKGKFEFNLEGEKQILTAGDSVYIPSNAKHGLVALEDSIIVDVFSPQREDFLK